jgi:acylphosphatase
VSAAAVEIIVEGHVQGVGYRNYAQRRAAMLGVGGFVMNLKDGRVRVHAEGDRAVIEELVRQLEQGPRHARVERVGVRWVMPTGGFNRFDIRDAERDA